MRSLGLATVFAGLAGFVILYVATWALEVLEQGPPPDVLLVPIGLGSSASGASLVAAWRSPTTKVIGVQAENAASVASMFLTLEVAIADVPKKEESAPPMPGGGMGGMDF